MIRSSAATPHGFQQTTNARRASVEARACRTPGVTRKGITQRKLKKKKKMESENHAFEPLDIEHECAVANSARTPLAMVLVLHTVCITV